VTPPSALARNALGSNSDFDFFATVIPCKRHGLPSRCRQSKPTVKTMTNAVVAQRRLFSSQL
jgi:hypothetical protein